MHPLPSESGYNIPEYGNIKLRLCVRDKVKDQINEKILLYKGTVHITCFFKFRSFNLHGI